MTKIGTHNFTRWMLCCLLNVKGTLTFMGCKMPAMHVGNLEAYHFMFNLKEISIFFTTRSCLFKVESRSISIPSIPIASLYGMFSYIYHILPLKANPSIPYMDATGYTTNDYTCYIYRGMKISTQLPYLKLSRGLFKGNCVFFRKGAH